MNFKSIKHTLGAIGATSALLIGGCGDDPKDTGTDVAAEDTSTADTSAVDSDNGTDTASGEDTVSVADGVSEDDTTVVADTSDPDDVAVADDTAGPDDTSDDVVPAAPSLTTDLKVVYTTSGQATQSIQNLNCIPDFPAGPSLGFERDEGTDKVFVFKCFLDVPGGPPWVVGFDARNPFAGYNAVAAIPQSGLPSLVAVMSRVDNQWSVGPGFPDFAVRVIFSEYSSEDRHAVGTIDYTQRSFSTNNPTLPTFNVNGSFDATW